MGKSPGHQKWPEHAVREQPVDKKLKVEIGGKVVAESNDVIRVVEDGHPARNYFPRSDVNMAALEPSDTTTECPFKGKAQYFTLNVGGKKLEDTVWTYEDPYDEHSALKERIAFYEEKIPSLETKTAS